MGNIDYFLKYESHIFFADNFSPHQFTVVEMVRIQYFPQ